ncbi:MAG: HigA family addiction module antidote protein [Rhodobacteraceae bacterium]|nr:HigA family addiction module antidote protein [Paracoccaceae bacterium]
MNIASSLSEVPHPGEFIKDELEARGWLQRDLAYILGVSEQAINPIQSGKRGISPEMALAFSKAFDISPEYFMNLQKAYDLSIARAADPAIERRAFLQSTYPIREMVKRGWFAVTEDVSMLEAQLMRLFQTNSLTEVPCLSYNAKKGSDYAETTPLQWAWLFRVRQIASEMIVPAYSESSLRAAISSMPRLMVDPEEVRHVPRILAECGVRFLVVETLQKANIDGVCFWLDGSPVVGMTCRHDRIDNFWFVLRHELEHLLNRDGQKDHPSPQMVDMDMDVLTGDLPPEEVLANEAAAEFCAPQEDIESFFVRKYPYMSEKDTLGLARRLQRHPGIVVGQLQRRSGKYDWLAKHKAKIRNFLFSAAVVDGWGNPVSVSL